MERTVGEDGKKAMPGDVSGGEWLVPQDDDKEMTMAIHVTREAMMERMASKDGKKMLRWG